jgi:hypothetical protein
MEMKTVSETSDNNSMLKWLITRETLARVETTVPQQPSYL